MRSAFAAVVIASMLMTANAFAAPDGGDESVDTLEKQLREETAALSTQDCVTACKALASIRRAADRICGLEPGPRCSDARAKADDAHRRVQAACPDCQIAAAPPKDEDRRATQPAPPPASPGAVDAKTANESAPHRGGCASCSTTGDRATGDLGVMLLGVLAVARALRKRGRNTVR